MEKAPTVSVVIPAYNPGPFLRDALESVVSQTYADWECIVVDDGSDENLEWVPGFHPRVMLLRQENRGLPGARNAGAMAGRGRFIAFLDADDVWLPDKLARQIEVMTGGVTLSATAFYRFAEGERRAGWAPDATSFTGLLRGNSICASSAMVERGAFESVGRFDERLRSGEDWDLWMRLARLGPVVGLDEVLTGYRLHGGQMSNKIPTMWWWSLRVLMRQRGPIIPTLVGVRRMGVVYGSQMFDQFRENRRPGSLAWSLVMGPEYVLGEALRQIKMLGGRGPSRP